MSSSPSALNLHANVVAFGPAQGVLIRGASGAGKSRLSLALIGQGAQLVADDRAILFASEGGLYARAPRAISGLIESRGLGILSLFPLPLAKITLIVDLGVAPAPRFPDPERETLLGVELPRVIGRSEPDFSLALCHLLRAQNRV